MADRISALITGEGNWLPLAMVVATAVTLASLPRAGSTAARARTMAAMNVFVGSTLLIMGAGHLLAVTTKLLHGTLNGSAPLLYLIGVLIVVPAALIVRHSRGPAPALNGWMAGTLAVLGLINIPLAIPALLNVAYARHARTITGRLIVAAWILVNLGLFTGGMLFMLSGARTFEEFQGLQ